MVYGMSTKYGKLETSGQTMEKSEFLFLVKQTFTEPSRSGVGALPRDFTKALCPTQKLHESSHSSGGETLWLVEFLLQWLRVARFGFILILTR